MLITQEPTVLDSSHCRFLFLKVYLGDIGLSCPHVNQDASGGQLLQVFRSKIICILIFNT
jgi:hypothetical protein